MVYAFVYIHENKLIHGDIKCSNVLIDDGYHIKICDFGLTKFAGLQTSKSLRGVGTAPWKAPELIPLAGDSRKGKAGRPARTRTFASDVYALGMTIAEVSLHIDDSTGLLPMTNFSIIQLSACGGRDPSPTMSPKATSKGSFFEETDHHKIRCRELMETFTT